MAPVNPPDDAHDWSGLFSVSSNSCAIDRFTIIARYWYGYTYTVALKQEIKEAKVSTR